MTLVRWDPFRNVATLQDRINRMFEESFARSRDLDDDTGLCAWRPVVDIYETEQGIVVKAELPGVKKEDVSVEIKNNLLTLRGERLIDEQVKEENYYRKERCFGTFHRSFTLQDSVEPERIKATFKDGVLKVVIPRPEQEKPKQITVDVE